MTAAGENMMSSMSIKERIRALNLQSQSVGAPDSPTRQSNNINTTNRKQQLSGSSIKTPLPAVSALPVVADPSFLEPLPSTTTKSTSPLRSSPTSEKAQLFKAAKVIRKAFDTTEAGSNFLDGSHSYNSQPSSPNSRQTADDEGDDNFDRYEEELDATKALKSWRNKGMAMASDGPTLVHEVSSYHVNETVGDDPTTPIITSYPEIRTTNAHSASGKEAALAIAGGYETKNYNTNESRPMEAAGTADEQMITPSGNDTDETRYESKSSSQYTMASGEPYRAYARRSRLRSPRGSGLSPDGGSFVDVMDGTQSVTSAQSAMSQSSLSQISSLSTRATRFLKDKKDRRKEAAFLTTGGDGGGGDGEDAISNSKFDELAKDIVHNTLRGDASKQPNLHQAGGDVDEKNSESLSNHSSREWATVGSRGTTPQTIDIRPSIPKMGGYISDLNRDVIYQDRPQDQSKQPDEYQFTPTYDEFHRINPNSELQGYPTKEDQPQHNYDQTASLDGSMCSELKGKDLFDIHTSTRGMKEMKKQSAFSRIDNACSGSESNSDFTPFQHGVGKSFDTGCQVLESMNPLPLIESAFNALSARSQAKSVFFGDARKSVPRNTARSSDGDAPFDEDAPPDEPVSETVAIEVEYVEHGDEHHSMAETDSVFSVSTRDLESINT